MSGTYVPPHLRNRQRPANEDRVPSNSPQRSRGGDWSLGGSGEKTLCQSSFSHTSYCSRHQAEVVDSVVIGETVEVEVEVATDGQPMILPSQGQGMRDSKGSFLVILMTARILFRYI
jgi:hypothetical protein